MTSGRGFSAFRTGLIGSVALVAAGVAGIGHAEGRNPLLLTVNNALEKLESLDQRQAQLVELRFFGGLSEDEVARVLGIAPRTVNRDWNFARAWLHGELSRPASA